MTSTHFLVFGDSHAVIWEGRDVLRRAKHARFPTVKSFHLGEALAFNLLDESGRGLGKWGEQVFAKLDEFLETETPVSGVMLCFGEIDVRTQVVSRALARRSGIEQEVSVVASRLIAFARMLFETFRIPVLIWEPVPSSSTATFDRTYPATGTETERNYATACFKDFLRAAAKEDESAGRPIYTFGAFDRLTNFYETRAEFFADGCHLNLNGLRVALEELDALCKTHGLGFTAHFTASPNLLSAPHVRNVAAEAKVELSSVKHGPPSLARSKDAGFCFHTLREAQPYALIDLGSAAFVETLILYNRFDAAFECAKTISVYVGNTLNGLRKIYQHGESWGEDGAPLVVEVPENTGPVRHFMLRLTDENSLHLGEVRIMARTFHKD